MDFPAHCAPDPYRRVTARARFFRAPPRAATPFRALLRILRRAARCPAVPESRAVVCKTIWTREALQAADDHDHLPCGFRAGDRRISPLACAVLRRSRPAPAEIRPDAADRFVHARSR